MKRFIRFTIYSLAFLYICIGLVNCAEAVHSVAGRRKSFTRGLLFAVFIFLAGLTFVSPAFGATEFVSVVDPGNGTGTDYTSLSAWNTGVVTNLTAATTQVFAGTRNNSVADNATVYLCNSANAYREESATVVHATATQILVESIANAVTEASTDYWYSTNTCGSGTKYFTISDGGNSAIAVATCRTTNGAADTAAVGISGWTTSATNYIKVWTDPAEPYRHQGKWDDTKYRLEGTTGEFLFISTADVWIDGLQIYTSYYKAVRVAEMNTVFNFRFSNNIVRGNTGDGNAGNNWTIDLCYDAPGSKAYVWNNIIYNTTPNGYGFFIYYYYWNTYLYNNTIYGFPVGVYDGGGSSSTEHMKNNIIEATDAFSGTFIDDDAYNDYNSISENYNDPIIGSHGKYNQTFTFVNANKNDFHLANDDTGAKNNGILLYDSGDDANLNFTTDIDGSSRQDLAGTWDIGADEAATMIYYSVGQNTNSNETGAGNVDVDAATRTATFTVAQTATNMGVGDVIDYDSNNKICYITEKVSTTVWKCQSAIGGAPTAASGVVVNSIHHAFASLSLAEAGSTGASYLNTTNLITGNYVLNIPCYYDSGPDQTAVTVNGYTTGSANYIKIYTPNNTTSEVNQSQRHSGKWDTGKYRLEVSDSTAINDYTNYVKFDGLQVKVTTSSGAYNYGINFENVVAGSGNIVVSNNIVQGSYSGTATGGKGIILYNPSGSPTLNVYNNIVYGFVNGSSFTFYGIQMTNSAATTAYLYNNTVVNCYYGYAGSGSIDVLAKNNIAQNTTIGYGGTFDNSSDYNISDHADTPGSPGTHNKNTTTVTFIDATNSDFHLAFADTGAKGYGVNLMNDTYLAFQNDIDGQERTGNWSIGADEPRETEIQSSAQKVESITDGLVLYQSFDGGHMDWSNTSAEALDATANNNDGDVVGATSAIGKRGQALSFDGSSDEIIVGNPSSLNDLAPMTLSAWIYPRSLGGGSRARILDKATDNSATNGFFFNISNDTVNNHIQFTRAYGASPVERLSVADSISFNEWQHVVITWDGTANHTGIHMYKDGVELSYDATNYLDGGVAMTTDVSSLLRVGNSASGNRGFDGLIDEVRIYDRALSPAEIGDLYTLGQEKINMSLTNKNTSGLVGMWSFDGADMEWDDTDAEALDRSGNVNDGDVVGATSAIGKRGQALSFNGTSNYVTAASTGSGMFSSPSTISVWLNSRVATGSWRGAVTQGANGAGFWWLGFYSGRFYFYGNAGAQTLYSGLITANTWYHVTIVQNASNLLMYVDGQQVDSDPVSSTGNSGNLFIGRTDGYSEFWSGSIDEVRVYDRALSPDEVGDLYRLGTATMKR